MTRLHRLATGAILAGLVPALMTCSSPTPPASTTGGTTGGGLSTLPGQTTSPLLCRLNLRHHWHYETNPEDRTRSRVCARCGKDDPRLGNPGLGRLSCHSVHAADHAAEFRTGAAIFWAAAG